MGKGHNFLLCASDSCSTCPLETKREPQEFLVTMDTMKEAMASLAAQRQLPGSCAGHSAGGISGALLANLAWLLGTGAGYAQRALSKADVAAVFLSRKILLSGLPMHGALPGLQRTAGLLQGGVLKAPDTAACQIWGLVLGSSAA